MGEVIIVQGAPCSGKTTYCKENMTEKDVVYDADALSNALRYGTEHDRQEYLYPLVAHLRYQYVYFIEHEMQAPEIETFYFITTTLESKDAARLIAYGAEIIQIQATKEECLSNLQKDDSRKDKEYWTQVINDWFDAQENQSVQESARIFQKLLSAFLNF